MIVKYEVWKNKKKYIVARDKGKIIQKRQLKGSGIKNKRQALSIFKKNKTFYKNRVRTVLTNVTEHHIFKKVLYDKNNLEPWKTKPIKKPRGKAQYVVQGMFNKKMFYGRSHKKGSFSDLQTSKQCKKEAWEKFLSIISQSDNGLYDEDEGIKVMENEKVTNISEGWIYYN